MLPLLFLTNTRLVDLCLFTFTSIICCVLFHIVSKQIGSVNLLNLPAASPYAFGLAALVVLFTQEELSTSLMYQTRRSMRRALNPDKVQILISEQNHWSILCTNKHRSTFHLTMIVYSVHPTEAINEKFGEGAWELRTLKAKINQKCRDTKLQQHLCPCNILRRFNFLYCFCPL